MICFFNTSGQIVSSMETRVRAFSLPKPCCQKFSSTTCFTRTRIICKPLCRFKQHALRLTESPPFSPASNTTGSRPHRGGGSGRKKCPNYPAVALETSCQRSFPPKDLGNIAHKTLGMFSGKFYFPRSPSLFLFSLSPSNSPIFLL